VSFGAIAPRRIFGHMKITLLHPSRGRAEKARENAKRWLHKSSRNHTVEYILSLDQDDPQLPKYEELFAQFTPHIIINANTCVVDATNAAAKKSTGDILVYFSDDFDCPQNWDDELVKSFQGVETPRLIKVDDCLQPFDVKVLTIPIMNRQLYEKLGYFWHPGYKSMFVDEDLYWTCFTNGWMIMKPALKFPHEHWVNGKAPVDETYKNSEKNWDQGKALYAERMELGFPV
jgi:hypothetical protein